MTHGTAVEEQQPSHDAEAVASSSSVAAMKDAVAAVNGHPNSIIVMELIKDEYGFGFNVVGGSDSEHLPGDSGIFVSMIKPEGVAERDGRLQEGDKILSVNGVDLLNLTHDEAVNVLRQVKEAASLVVQTSAEQTIITHHSPVASTPASRIPPAEDPKPKAANGPQTSSSMMSFADLVGRPPTAPSSLPPSRSKREDKRDDDEESVYAPSTHSFIDDVPRTPRKKKTLLEEANPFITEAVYVGIGLAVISVAAVVTYRLFFRRQ